MLRSLLFSAALVSAPLPVLAQDFRLDSTVATMQVMDLKGTPASFDASGAPATVVIFISTQCPVSNGYNERMKTLYQDYSARGVRFVFVNANRAEDAANVADHAQKHGFTFAVYKDPDNALADRFNAQVTPETFVMDRSGVMRYHGAIDDSPSSEARVTARPLREALDAVLSGGTVARKEVKAMGCSIKRVAGSGARKTSS